MVWEEGSVRRVNDPAAHFPSRQKKYPHWPPHKELPWARYRNSAFCMWEMVRMRTRNADAPSLLDPKEMATSVCSCGSANFRSDGDKSRHPCKLSPEDSRAAVALGYTCYGRWQSLEKSIICDVLYLRRQDTLSRLQICSIGITCYNISRNYTSRGTRINAPLSSFTKISQLKLKLITKNV